ncbi:hypothetical protein FSARC_12718 [Fusarium sarcochroum]|uniref:Uncharacterized protein n=1 Tax=Fusarium sarcochroum TaxID=1208366 RepID=A0A8H4T699_9HYPO|nr:hypothetical protein FSARC_12718 [Fusarium sarcochroum]
MASGLFSNFSPWHIPACFIGTAFTLGGLLPFRAPYRAMREYGLPEGIARSEPAGLAFAIYGARVSAYGVALWLFYLRRRYDVVDTLMSLLFWWGVADLWICLKAGATKTAITRFVSSLAIGGWGYLGCTARGSL